MSYVVIPDIKMSDYGSVEDIKRKIADGIIAHTNCSRKTEAY